MPAPVDYAPQARPAKRPLIERLVTWTQRPWTRLGLIVVGIAVACVTALLFVQPNAFQSLFYTWEALTAAIIGCAVLAVVALLLFLDRLLPPMGKP